MTAADRNDLLAELEKTFGQDTPEYLEIAAKVKEVSPVPYGPLILKLKEGRTKRVKQSHLVSMLGRSLDYFYRFAADREVLIKDKKLKAGDEVMYDLLLDTAVAGQPYEHFTGIISPAIAAGLTLDAIVEYYNSYFQLLSYDVSGEVALKFITVLIRDPGRKTMLPLLDFYLSYALVKQIPPDIAINAMTGYRGEISRKKMINYLEDVR